MTSSIDFGGNRSASGAAGVAVGERSVTGAETRAIKARARSRPADGPKAGPPRRVDPYNCDSVESALSGISLAPHENRDRSHDFGGIVGDRARRVRFWRAIWCLGLAFRIHAGARQPLHGPGDRRP